MIPEFEQCTLGVVSHKKLWVDPEGLKTTGGFGRQIEELSRYFGRTVLVVPCQRRHSPAPGYIVRIEDNEIIPLPYFSGVGLRGKLDFLLKIPRIAPGIWRAYKQCDILHYRVPGYVGILGLLVHKLQRSRPGFIWMGTDWPARIRHTNDTWPRPLMASTVARVLPWLIQGIPTFALGQMPGEYGGAHPYVHQTISTVLSADDIPDLNDSKLATPPRLLFVGRLAVEKGLRYLVEAVALCNRKNLILDLTIVGNGPEKNNLKQLVAEHGLEERVCFKGFVPLGDDLWELYRQADIFALPSLSEGQGKVLIEAMANGLVVVATRVGGIPTVVENNVNGLLIEPRSAGAIVQAIERILREPETRRKLRQNALAAARAYSIERQTQRLVSQLGEDFRALGWQA